MRIAANYSRPLAQLISQQRVQVERLKCPAWPWLIEEAGRIGRPYVHFPLEVGSGSGDAVDTERHGPPDWAALERLLRETDSAHVNLHLGAPAGAYPGLPVGSLAEHASARVAERAIGDAAAVLRRFGAERVAVENALDDYGLHMLAALLPQTVARVVREAGCGLVLDLAHARIAAGEVGLDERDYLQALPVERLREVHVTGVQTLDAAWQERLRGAGADLTNLAPYFDRDLDHLPPTPADWCFLEWAFPWLRAHAPEPWVVAAELGGVGPRWETLAIPEVLESTLARLRALAVW